MHNIEQFKKLLEPPKLTTTEDILKMKRKSSCRKEMSRQLAEEIKVKPKFLP